MQRRDFLKKTLWSAGVAVLGDSLSQAAHAAEAAPSVPVDQTANTNAPRLVRRPYGKTGLQLSIIGFGGLTLKNTEQKFANRLVAQAFEKGVNYFDVAPTYGNAEERLGPALEPYRKDVFLACKTTQRTRQAAADELQASLKKLRTDHVELYQLHAITDVEKDVDAVFAKGGAMETFIEAKKTGQIRYLGFSAHSTAAALAALDRYDFDSVLFPISFPTFYAGNFGPKVVAHAQQKGAARLALKMLARQDWPADAPDRKKYPNCWYQPVTDPQEALLAMRFTLSQPVTAAVPPAHPDIFLKALDLALQFEPLTDQQQAQLKKLATTLNPVFKNKKEVKTTV